MINLIGLSGAFTILIAYFLNASQILNSNDLLFHILNLIGATLLGYINYYNCYISPWHDAFFLGSLFIIGYSIYNIVRIVLYV